MTSSRNSLEDHDNPADRIRQHRQASDNPILVVEGVGDLLVLEPLLPSVDIFPVKGKPQVVNTARTLVSWAIFEFVCITDNDFDDPALLADLEAVHIPWERTDLEAMLITLGVLASCIEHLGSLTKIEAHGGSAKLIDDLISCVRPVSALREANTRQKWGLPFDDVPIASKIKRDLVFDIQGYCTALLRNMDKPVAKKTVLEVADNGPSSAELFRGKDVVAAAGVALRKIAGTLPQAATDADLLSAQLRSSAGHALCQSAWFASLRDRLNSLGTAKT